MAICLFFNNRFNMIPHGPLTANIRPFDFLKVRNLVFIEWALAVVEIGLGLQILAINSGIEAEGVTIRLS